MRKTLKIVAIVLVVLFTVVQFIRPDRTLPAVDQSVTIEATAKVPDDIKAILRRSCSDCHSNETVYPWYSNVSPASWFLQDHINEGRDELNFSLWGTYSESRKARKLDEICENVKSREMPLPSYLWIHRYARMGDDEIALLCRWTESVRAEMDQ